MSRPMEAKPATRWRRKELAVVEEKKVGESREGQATSPDIDGVHGQENEGGSKWVSCWTPLVLSMVLCPITREEGDL